MVVFSYNIRMQTHLAIYHPKHAGILSAAIELKAEKILLLHQQDDDISGLQSVLRSRGIECITQVAEFDTMAARRQMAEILESHQQENIVFNASSGYHKLTLIAFEQFNDFGYPVFLVDKFTNELSWLNQPESQANLPLGHHIRLKEYLKTFNTQVLSMGQTTPEPASSRQLTGWLIEQLGQADKSIGTLNYMASSANQHNRYAMRKEDERNTELREFLHHFETAGKLTIKGRYIQFNSPEDRFYCNGGWLENHVFALLFGIRKNRPQIAELAKGVTLVRNQGQVKNELDVAAICHNRLHIIECKTKRFKNKSSDQSAASSAIYRLDTLKSIAGGHSGKAMMISYKELNKYTLSRAKDLGIYCCSHTQLKQLERHLYQFIDHNTGAHNP